jgi:hypothetical protein
LFVEHKGLKCIASLAVAVVIDVLTNVLVGLSDWKQAIVTIVLCLMISFLHLHRLYQFIIHLSYVLQYNANLFLNYIWRLVFGGAGENDPNAQPVMIRF